MKFIVLPETGERKFFAVFYRIHCLQNKVKNKKQNKKH